MTVLKVTQRLDQPEQAQAMLTLPYELRQKSRLRTRLDTGEEVGLMLPRGQVMRGGDCLKAENGIVIELKAAPEAVSTASSIEPLTLQRACYHLGNRHVPLQISEQWVRYLQDHVLDEMVASFGLKIKHEQAPFEPEVGAYHSHGEGGGHNHSHHHHD